MATKHTPGPWWVGGTGTDVLANIPGFESVWAVAECRVPEPTLGGIETFPSKANALLISAAPEMLGECRAAKWIYEAMLIDCPDGEIKTKLQQRITSLEAILAKVG